MLNEKILTPEFLEKVKSASSAAALLEKVKSATSAAALLAFAQENGIDLSAEEATVYYTKLHPEIGALSDEEMDNVAGGGCGDGRVCPKCGSTNTKGGFGWCECHDCELNFHAFR